MLSRSNKSSLTYFNGFVTHGAGKNFIGVKFHSDSIKKKRKRQHVVMFLINTISVSLKQRILKFYIYKIFFSITVLCFFIQHSTTISLLCTVGSASTKTTKNKVFKINNKKNYNCLTLKIDMTALFRSSLLLVLI